MAYDSSPARLTSALEDRDVSAASSIGVDAVGNSMPMPWVETRGDGRGGRRIPERGSVNSVRGAEDSVEDMESSAAVLLVLVSAAEGAAFVTREGRGEANRPSSEVMIVGDLAGSLGPVVPPSSLVSTPANEPPVEATLGEEGV